MLVTTTPFDLATWRHRMGALRRLPGAITQAEAADLLGMSLSGYKRAEYRCQDRDATPCNKTVALLAQMLEREAAEG